MQSLVSVLLSEVLVKTFCLSDMYRKIKWLRDTLKVKGLIWDIASTKSMLLSNSTRNTDFDVYKVNYREKTEMYWVICLGGCWYF